jgi:cobyrinic acid a,c-diamide synthase
VAHIEEHLDLDLLLELGRPLESPAGRGVAASGGVAAMPGARPRVAVARDRAFSFYYEDNLDVLAEEGADVVTFAPADGETLPACDALYLGGGYPEVYAADLANNTILQRDLRAAAAGGLPIYAECGGYLYLGREIEYEGATHPMAGVLPTRATMAGGRLRLGYVEAAAVEPHPLAGESFRGHLFHYSSTEGSASPAYRVTRRGESFDDGYAGGRIAASYVHLHFRGSRAVARWLASGGRDVAETTSGREGGRA